MNRAAALGFDAVATGHHCRIVAGANGGPRLARATDPAKDQSYVLYMLGGDVLARTVFPIGALTKREVRERARALGLRTAAKPESQDVCFITRAGGGREAFLGSRIELRPGRLVDRAGSPVGEVDAVELVTVGQRRGLGSAGDGSPRYALDVDVEAATVVVGPAEEMLSRHSRVRDLVWVDEAARRRALAPDPAGLTGQVSAHGHPVALVSVALDDDGRSAVVEWAEPIRRVAPGQSVVVYDGDVVLGGGIVSR